MVELVGSGIELKSLSIGTGTWEDFLSSTTRGVMNMKERMHQRREKVLQAVPVLNAIDKRWKKFDARMEAKHGQVYTKIRDSAKNITRTVLAAKLFGLPGVVGMCAYKTCEKSLSLLEPAQIAKEKGEIKSLFDYFKQNKEEARFTTTSGAISICSAACDVAGAPAVKGAVRVGKASWLILPELKQLIKTTGKWLRGEESFTEVKRDAAVLAITFGTYFVSSVPMTHGSGKPKGTKESEEEKRKRAQKDDKTGDKIKNVINKGQECAGQVRDFLNKGAESSKNAITSLALKRNKEGR